MSVPRLLILAGYHPAVPYVGGLLLGDVARLYPRDRIFSYSFRMDWPLSGEFGWLPSEFGNGLPQKGYCTSTRTLVRAATVPFRMVAWKRQVSRLVKQAVRFGRRCGVEKIWAVADYETNILMTRRVARALGVPYVTTVWDPPDQYAPHRGLDRTFVPGLMREFSRMQRGAAACGVASENMAREYSRLYGVRCVVLRHAVPRRLWRPARTAPAADGVLRIGFAGSLYAKDEFNALLAALDSRAWRVAGREVTIDLLGEHFQLRRHSPVRILLHGYQPLAKAIEILHGADLGYVPYWFDESRSAAVRMCFPGKIASYAAAGIPVFFHGPQGSSPAEFMRRYPVGAACHSLDPEEIVRALEAFVSDPGSYAVAADAIERAREEELNLEHYAQHFAELLGIDASELAPADGEEDAGP